MFAGGASARVTYGLAKEARLPAWLGAVSERTRTPLRATVIVAGVVLGLALFTPLDVLAETTSEVMLSVFFMVNLALVRLKLTGPPVPSGGFAVPLAVPIGGVLTCVGLLAGAWLTGG